MLHSRTSRSTALVRRSAFLFFHIYHAFTLRRTLSLTGSAARPRFIPGRYLFFFWMSVGKRSLPWAGVACLEIYR